MGLDVMSNVEIAWCIVAMKPQRSKIHSALLGGSSEQLEPRSSPMRYKDRTFVFQLHFLPQRFWVPAIEIES